MSQRSIDKVDKIEGGLVGVMTFEDVLKLAVEALGNVEVAAMVVALAPKRLKLRCRRI
jgi:hypothetical protein